MANLERVAAMTRGLGASLRPHVKTHKSPEIVRRQLAAGARGVTAATLREAEMAIEAGAGDVLVAYPPVGTWRLEAIDRLLDRARVIVACSELAHVEALATLDRPVEYYWEIDSGTGRLGTPPGEPTADTLVAAAALTSARLAGIMAFAGHAYAARGTAAAAAAEEAGALAATVRALRARGIDPGEISTGVTPLSATAVPGATEYRFGNYAFCDATQVALGSAALDQCALGVVSTVVGRPTPDRVILDAGSKALAAERMSEATDTFAIVRRHPELRVERLYEEHAICRVEGRTTLSVGDRVEVVPNHACACANLHEAYVVRLADGGEARWPIAARGWDMQAPAMLPAAGWGDRES